MSRAYDFWIHQQLEPTDKIVMGNHKRIHEVKKNIIIKNPSPDFRTEKQIKAAEDEYLKKYGIC